MYALDPPTTKYESAQCLYKVVSLGSPEAMEQFNQAEIGMVEDPAGVNHPVFIDGWGTPICWLRWAPGFSNWTGFPSNAPTNPGDSDIQTGYAGSDSDPFDPRGIDYHPIDSPPRGYHLIPLICSAGPDEQFGLVGLQFNAEGFPDKAGDGVRNLDNDGDGYSDPSYPRLPDISDPYATVGGGATLMGSPVVGTPDAGTQHDNITNHHIEQR